MAMNDDERDPVLDRAADTLRELTDAGWVRARPHVVQRALRALRPSVPVRARHDAGDFTVGADVLAARLRATLDRRADVRVTRVACTVGTEGELEAVAVGLDIRFGVPIATMSASVRAESARTISAVLGTGFPPDRVVVDLCVTDVHPAPRPDGPAAGRAG